MADTRSPLVGDQPALGRRVRIGVPPSSAPGPWYEIVGVIDDLRANTSQGTMYLAAAADGAPAALHLALHGGPAPADTARRLREVASALDARLRLDDVRTLDEVYRESAMTGNLTAYALAAATTSVLLLSAAGLYALMSFTVARRRRELGIRAALGAPGPRLVTAVFARAMGQVGVGAVLGVLIALAVHRKSNVEVAGGWHIPGILPAAVALMVLLALLASAGPARRALAVDPNVALRDG